MFIEVISTSLDYKKIQKEDVKLFGDKAFYVEYKDKSAFYIEVNNLEEAIDYLAKVPAWQSKSPFELVVSRDTSISAFAAEYKIELYNDHRE